MSDGIKIPVISAIPVVGDIANWLADIVAMPINLVVNSGKTVFHAGGEALGNIPIFAKWGGLLGAGFGAFQASQEGKDILGGALDGGMKGLGGGAVLGAGVGIAKGTVEAGGATLAQAVGDASVVASGLFTTSGGGGGVQNLPSKPPQSGGKNVG